MVEPILKKGGLILSNIRKEHTHRIMNWRNSQMSILRQYKPLTEKNQEDWFIQLSTDSNQFLFSIYLDNSSPCLIGYCGLTNVNFKNRTGEISFLLSTTYVNDAEKYDQYFSSVLSLLSKYAFNDLNLNKIFSETYSFRRMHMSVLEKNGFHCDGVLRDHVYENGSYYDSYVHSLLSEEWRSRSNDEK